MLQTPKSVVQLSPRHMSALSRAGIAVWEWLPEGDALRWDDKLHVLMDMPDGTRCGSLVSIEERLHPDDRALVRNLLQATAGTKADFHCQLRVHYRDGSLHHLVMIGTWDGDRIAGVAQSLDDMYALQHKENTLRGMVDAALSDASVGMWTWEVDRNFITWDSTTHRIFEAEIGKFAGTIEAVYGFVHPDDRELVKANIADTLEKGPGAVTHIEHRIIHSDDSVHWVQVHSRLATNPYGSGLMFFGTVQQIDDTRRREDELKRSNRDLEQFAYITSHDLQEPLRNISHYVQKLTCSLEGKTDAQNRYVSHVINGTSRMLQMIQGLLDYSRVDSKGRPFGWFPIKHAVLEAKEHLMVTFREYNASLDMSEVHNFELCADRNQVVRLLLNLFQNALKYSRADVTPRISVSTERKEACILIRVKDNGIGIDPKHWERIFLTFKQLDSNSRKSGVGIGLTICQRIAQRHGGSIKVESSKPGEGTTFLVKFPERHTVCLDPEE